MSKKPVKIYSSVSDMETELRAKQTLIKEQEKYLAFHQQKTKELEEVVEEAVPEKKAAPKAKKETATEEKKPAAKKAPAKPKAATADKAKSAKPAAAKKVSAVKTGSSRGK